LSWSATLLATTTRVVGILQMVFTNSIMITHVNWVVDWPLMNWMVTGGYRSVHVVHPRGGYWESIDINLPILDYKNGHYVKPTRVALKYLDFKKYIDPNAHVRVFNFVVKANVYTFEIISSMCLAIC
jgi:hypothetical protein